MCGSMADIQSATAEIRRGIKKKEETTKCPHLLRMTAIFLIAHVTPEMNRLIFPHNNDNIELLNDILLCTPGAVRRTAMSVSVSIALNLTLTLNQ